LSDPRVKPIIENPAAPKHATRFGQKKRLVAQSQSFNHSPRHFDEFFRGGLKKRACVFIAFSCGFCNEGKHFGEDAVRIGTNSIL
jgi:hypothetical protein